LNALLRPRILSASHTYPEMTTVPVTVLVHILLAGRLQSAPPLKQSLECTPMSPASKSAPPPCQFIDGAALNHTGKKLPWVLVPPTHAGCPPPINQAGKCRRSM